MIALREKSLPVHLFRRSSRRVLPILLFPLFLTGLTCLSPTWELTLVEAGATDGGLSASSDMTWRSVGFAYVSEAEGDALIRIGMEVVSVEGNRGTDSLTLARPGDTASSGSSGGPAYWSPMVLSLSGCEEAPVCPAVKWTHLPEGTWDIIVGPHVLVETGTVEITSDQLVILYTEDEVEYTVVYTVEPG